MFVYYVLMVAHGMTATDRCPELLSPSVSPTTARAPLPCGEAVAAGFVCLA
jgi:hypothetical protein